MMGKITFALSCLAILFIGASADCDKWPEGVHFVECCDLPDWGDENVTRRIAETMQSEKLDKYMLNCKAVEGAFKELKLIKDGVVDKEALFKVMDKEITQPFWKPAMKAAAEHCINDMAKRKEDIYKELEQAPYNIKKQQCDPLFISLAVCISFEGFKICPKEALTENKKCPELNTWFAKCRDHIDHFGEIKPKKPATH